MGRAPWEDGGGWLLKGESVVRVDRRGIVVTKRAVSKGASCRSPIIAIFHTMNRVTLSLVLGLLGSVASFSAVPISRQRAAFRAAAIRLHYSGDTTRGLEALTPEQQKAFSPRPTRSTRCRSCVRPMQQCGSACARRPALASLSDEELNATCTNTLKQPSITDVLFKTPVGPVFALNVIAAATGFSWRAVCQQRQSRMRAAGRGRAVNE